MQKTIVLYIAYTEKPVKSKAVNQSIRGAAGQGPELVSLLMFTTHALKRYSKSYHTNFSSDQKCLNFFCLAIPITSV